MSTTNVLYDKRGGIIIKCLPNTLTFLNMSMGIMIILLLSQDLYINKIALAFLFIIIGGVADFFDGYVARKLNIITDIGKELDSFADIITFGIAPIMMLNYVIPNNFMWAVIIWALVYILAAAFRLARYNLQDFSEFFLGLPITAAGIILGFYSFILQFFLLSTLMSVIITTVVIIILAVAMISKFKINRMVRGSVD